MPEFEISLVFRGDYDEESSAFEHGDLLAYYVEHADPSLSVDVKLSEVNP